MDKVSPDGEEFRGIALIRLFSDSGKVEDFFTDAFELVDLEAAQGLRAIGAGRIQAFQHGLRSNARPNRSHRCGPEFAKDG